jgi:hypothetical protein
LSGAQLEGAILIGNPIESTSLKSTDFDTVTGDYMALKSVDFTDAKISYTALNPMFGDGSVILPEGIKRPCHWASNNLELGSYGPWGPSEDDPFIGRWRGWVEANGGAWPTSPLFDDFKNVIAIPPPPECPLVKDM